MKYQWKIFYSWFLSLFFTQEIKAQELVKISDQLWRLMQFKSKFVLSRNIEIYLPEHYHDSLVSYPVIYWHDGQNLFDSAVAYNSNPLEMDRCIEKLKKEANVEDCIVVGIWNSKERFREFMPEDIFRSLSRSSRNLLRLEYGGRPKSDLYLRFLIEEIKPYIDSNYRTLSDVDHCYIGGSSMGAIISLYAILKHPDLFSRACCLSTHWPWSVAHNTKEPFEQFMIYVKNLDLQKSLKSHRLYFDYGTENIDAWYEEYQTQLDSYILSLRISDFRYESRKFDGASHSELDWRKRLWIPMEFILEK
ncbi:MAG TPA: alpha/beta hydrolase-fold protein [Saprospiraceae bacterium]|nr:alpha/beta hydrolase-fold protein [Saprospiraceae bacterium]